MYQYDAIDQQLVNERVEQFKDQVRRRLADELPEDEFRPLRLHSALSRSATGCQVSRGTGIASGQ